MRIFLQLGALAGHLRIFSGCRTRTAQRAPCWMQRRCRDHPCIAQLRTIANAAWVNKGETRAFKKVPSLLALKLPQPSRIGPDSNPWGSLMRRAQSPVCPQACRRFARAPIGQDLGSKEYLADFSSLPQTIQEPLSAHLTKNAFHLWNSWLTSVQIRAIFDRYGFFDW